MDFNLVVTVTRVICSKVTMAMMPMLMIHNIRSLERNTEILQSTTTGNVEEAKSKNNSISQKEY